MMKYFYRLFKEYDIIKSSIQEIKSKRFFTGITKKDYTEYSDMSESTSYSLVIFDNSITIKKSFTGTGDAKYLVLINNKKIKTDKDLIEEFYYTIRNAHANITKLHNIFINLIGIPNGIFLPTYLTRRELVERFDEFEVIRNGEVDIISVNSLFDYYNNEFDEYHFLEMLRVSFENYKPVTYDLIPDPGFQIL